MESFKKFTKRWTGFLLLTPLSLSLILGTDSRLLKIIGGCIILSSEVLNVKNRDLMQDLFDIVVAYREAYQKLLDDYARK